MRRLMPLFNLGDRETERSKQMKRSVSTNIGLGGSKNASMQCSAKSKVIEVYDNAQYWLKKKKNDKPTVTI